MRAALTPRGPWLLGVGYAALLLLATSVVDARPDGGDGARLWWSTNLENLGAGAGRAVLVLVGSAFVAEESVGWWALFAVAGIVVAARRLGTARVGVLVGLVHVLATLVAEEVLARRISAGDVPGTARGLVDVGPSFVVVAALTVAVLYGRRWERLPAAVAFGALLPYLFTGLSDLDVAAVGHTVSIALTAGVAGVIVLRSRAGAAPAPAGVTP